MPTTPDLVPLVALKIHNVEYPVSVDRLGRFHAVFDEQNMSADTLNDLREQLNSASLKARKAVKLSIPVIEVTHKGVRRGTITGTHAASGNLLVSWNGPGPVKREQISSYERHRLLDPTRLGEDGIRELAMLREELGEREKRLRELTDQGMYADLRQVIEAANAG